MARTSSPPARTAVVTGSTRGLGRGVAEALGRAGVSVMVNAQDGAEAAQVAAELAALVPSARFASQACDVREPVQVEALARATERELGPIDLWINNAGLALTNATLDELAPADFALMMAINLGGVMNGCQQAARAMAGRGGAIYNILGAGSDGRPVPGMIGYATTKRAVQFLTRSFAAELAGGPVIVGGLSPGLVLTEGFFREHAKTPAPVRKAREAVVNILADDVRTLAQWIVRIALTNRENGREFRWLTPAKLRRRQAAIPSRDVLAPYRGADGTLRPAEAHRP